MLLAIDTATRKVGIALYDGVQVLHEVILGSGQRHTVELAPQIEATCRGAKIGMEDLKVIALATGPGSYTGLRIGAALAKGLALAHSLPLVGIPTHDILAAAQPPDTEKQLAVVLEAGRSRLAVGWYKVEEDHWVKSGEPELLTAEELSKSIKQPTLVCGELDEETRKILARKHKNVTLASPADSLRRPAYLAQLAWERWQAGESDDPATLAPFYLQTGENIPA